MRSNLLRVAALCLLVLIGNGLAWGADAPRASGDDPSVWTVDGIVITDMNALGDPPVYYNFSSFGEMTPPVLSETEAKNLCAEIGRTGWDWITRERALDIAPGLAPGIETAEDAGLLRGFLAVALQDTGCAEPPADVLAEALRYLVANDGDTIVIDEASMPDYNRCLPLRTYPEGKAPAPRDPQEALSGLPDPVPPLTDGPEMREV